MYIFVNSKESREDFPNDTGHNFSVKLTESVAVEGNWVCALKELKVQKRSGLDGHFMLISDICEPSHTYGEKISVLRTFDLARSSADTVTTETFSYDNGYYFPLRGGKVDTIHFTVKDFRFKPPKDQDILNISCVLHLKRLS